jgi:hypothetical protein
MLKIVSYGDLTFAPDYTAGFAPGQEWGLPAVQAHVTEREQAWPVVAGIRRQSAALNLIVRIAGSDKRALRDALLRALSPENETPQPLIISDPDGNDPRYVLAVPEMVTPVNTGKTASVDVFAVQLRVHGDVRWRSTAESTDVWNITGSGQTRAVVNSGTEVAFPIFRFSPTEAKSGSYAYRRWVAVLWKSQNAASYYPLRLDLDTATLVAAGKMQADGDDLRLMVDGVERDRWLADMNTAATKIWVDLSFQPTVSMTLRVGIPASGTIASVEVNEDITQLPQTGILLIDSEAFIYTQKYDSDRKLTGITRAARGTAEAAHTASTSVHWIQHDTWLLYGNSGVAAPTTNDSRKPAFSLSDSSNTSWVYTEFNDQSGARAGGWMRWGNITTTGNGGVYTATQRALSSDDFTVIGAWLASQQGNAYGWYLSNPCGMVNVTWSNGYKRRAGADFLVHCMHWVRGASWWSWHYNPAAPTAAATWETWSYSGSAFAVSDIIALAAYFYAQDIEAGSVTVTLNSSETPTVSVGSELGAYYLDCILENQTTGESVRVTATLALGQEMEVNCDLRTVTLVTDGSRMLSALSLLGTPRTNWMTLASGNNLLQFTDVGTTGVTLTTEFEPRWF